MTLYEAGSLAGLRCPHALSEAQTEGQRRDLSPRGLAQGLCPALPCPAWAPGTPSMVATRPVTPQLAWDRPLGHGLEVKVSILFLVYFSCSSYDNAVT